MNFCLPRDAAIYTKSILDRSRDLITHNVWNGFRLHRLDAWINNFRTDEECYFAAKVLDSLIYRSRDQTVALMQQLFQRTIPDLQRFEHISPALSNVYEGLKEEVDPNVRIVPVLPFGRPPIQSGASVSRHLRRSLGFQPSWIVENSQVTDLLSEGKVIIFFDDFLGTGTQFTEFVRDAELHTAVMSGQCIYAPLVGHENGLRSLEARFPNLRLAAAERLNETHAFFHKDAGNFPDDTNSVEVAKDFYYQLLEDRGIEINQMTRRGFGHSELVYAFEDAVPDNSLPILWWSNSPDWRPLFDR